MDNHYSPLIARGLRKRHHNAIAAVEVGWEREDDESLLVRCVDDQRALLTNNVADFVVIGRRWQLEGRSHHGLIFTSDGSRPRSRDTVGRYVSALDTLMKANPGSFVDRVHWL